MLLHPGVGLCIYFKHEQQLAEPDVIPPELKSTIGDSKRVDKHHVLATGLLRFLRHKWSRGYSHLTRMLYMPYQEGGVEGNVILIVVVSTASSQSMC